MRRARTSKPRVFFDTNVIFSGLYAQGGPPAKLLDAYVEQRLVMVVCQQILTELIRTLQEKLPQALPSLYFLLASIPPEILNDPPPAVIARWAQVIHASDAPILAAALSGQVEYLVTGNIRHFGRAGSIPGLAIVTPAQLVAELGL